jgi:hypothetical protein
MAKLETDLKFREKKFEEETKQFYDSIGLERDKLGQRGEEASALQKYREGTLEETISHHDDLISIYKERNKIKENLSNFVNRNQDKLMSMEGLLTTAFSTWDKVFNNYFDFSTDIMGGASWNQGKFDATVTE